MQCESYFSIIISRSRWYWCCHWHICHMANGQRTRMHSCVLGAYKSYFKTMHEIFTNHTTDFRCPNQQICTPHGSRQSSQFSSLQISIKPLCSPVKNRPNQHNACLYLSSPYVFPCGLRPGFFKPTIILQYRLARWARADHITSASGPRAYNDAQRDRPSADPSDHREARLFRHPKYPLQPDRP